VPLLRRAKTAICRRRRRRVGLTSDDRRSSSIAHQSEHALIHCGIPILNPSSVQEYLDLGLFGFALSRYAGCWVGFKCLTDTVDSAASVEVGRTGAPPARRLRAPARPASAGEPAAPGRGAALPAAAPAAQASCARTASAAWPAASGGDSAS
jgi:hypothetical protein